MSVPLRAAYIGSDVYTENNRIHNIHLQGTTETTSTERVPNFHFPLKPEPIPLKWSVLKLTERPYGSVFSPQAVDEIIVPIEVAKTVTFSAKVFESYRDLSISPHLLNRPHNEEILVWDRPNFIDGATYTVQILNTERGLLTLKFIRTDSNQNRSVQLNPDQDQIYGDFLGAAFAMGGWIRSFVEESNLPFPSDRSSYENVAMEVLKQLITQIDDDVFSNLIKLKEKGDSCRDFSKLQDLIEDYQKAQVEAIGFEGYATMMRRTLEEVAGDSASLHQEKILEKANQFAENVVKSAKIKDP